MSLGLISVCPGVTTSIQTLSHGTGLFAIDTKASKMQTFLHLAYQTWSASAVHTHTHSRTEIHEAATPLAVTPTQSLSQSSVRVMINPFPPFRASYDTCPYQSGLPCRRN